MSTLPAASTSAVPTSSVAERTPSPECTNPPVDLLTLVFQSDPVACYGNAPLTVDGYLTVMGGVIDGPCMVIEPAWFSCRSGIVTLEPVHGSAAVTSGNMLIACDPPCGGSLYAFPVAIDPASGIIDPATGRVPEALFGRNVRATGHFDDPAAQTCHAPPGVTGWGWETPPPASVWIAACLATFVATRIMPLNP